MISHAPAQMGANMFLPRSITQCPQAVSMMTLLTSFRVHRFCWGKVTTVDKVLLGKVSSKKFRHSTSVQCCW